MSGTAEKRQQPIRINCEMANLNISKEIMSPPAKRVKKYRRTQEPIAEVPTEAATVLAKILGKNFMNAAARLSLSEGPPCLSNVRLCSALHSKKGIAPEVASAGTVLQTLNLVRDNRPQEFLKALSDTCILITFPTEKLIMLLLELVLVYRPHPNNMTSEQMVQESVFVFFQILLVFPPCWHSLRKSYKQLLRSPLVLDKMCPEKYDSDLGIVGITLQIIENCVSSDDEPKPAVPTAEDDVDYNFLLWDERAQSEFEYNAIPRNEKLDRAFLVLHLLIKLMENDLAMWQLRYPHNPSKYIDDAEKGPLCAILWPSGCGIKSHIVKTVLHLFVSCISLKYPQDNIDILSRLLNVVANVALLSEQQPRNSTEIKYPYVHLNCKYLAMELKTTIKECWCYNVGLYVAVIKNIRTPYLKVIMSNTLLELLNHQGGPPSVEKVYTYMKKKTWLECRSESEDIAPNDVGLCEDKRYPVLQSSRVVSKTSEIYRGQYIDLLFGLFRAYVQLNHVDQVLQMHLKSDRECLQPEKPKKRSTVNALAHDLDFEAMERDIKDLERRVNMSDPVNTPDSLREMSAFDNILIDHALETQYRNDMKFMILLKKPIKALRQIHPLIFDEWDNYLDKFGD